MKKLTTIFIYIIGFSFFGFAQGNNYNIKFALLTDLHLNPGTVAEKNLLSIVNEINNLELDMVIVSGDLTNNGSNAELIAVKNVLDNLNKPYFIIPGNHETNWSESAGKKFIELWGSDRFLFELNNLIFVGYNTGPYLKMGDGHVKKEDLLWIENSLKTIYKPNKKIISIGHYPLNDGLDNWHEVVDILKKYKTITHLNGHGHALKLFNFDGIPGVMGRSIVLRNDTIPGYNIINIENDSLFAFEKTLTESPSLKIKFSIDNPQEIANLEISPRPDYSINDIYNKIKPDFIWQDTSSIFTGIALIENSVFVYGNSLGWLKAIDYNSNIVKWQLKFNGSLYSTPVYANNCIIIGDTDGFIYGINSINGKIKWKVDVGSPILASAVIENNFAYIGGGSKAFYKINIENGKVIWKFDNINGSTQSYPILHQDKIIFGVWDTHLYCLYKIDGKLIWKWNNTHSNILFSPGNVRPVASYDKVFIVAPDRYMTAIDLYSGKQIWRTNQYKVRESMGISPDGKEVYAKLMNDSLISVSSSNNQFSTNWIVNAQTGYDHNPCPVVASNKLVFGATKNGVVFAVDKENKKISWKHKLDNSSINAMILDKDNKIWISSMNGKIIRLVYDNK